MRQTRRLELGFRLRMSDDLMYKGQGKTNSGFKLPYNIWSWKQNELFRNVHEAQFEHLRKVYKRQWYEAFRVNADEYVYKYNITKAAQMAQWEGEMEAQERERQQVVQMTEGRQRLKGKHVDIMKEFHERQFFFWYERASERLQYMSNMSFVKHDDLDAHIDRELSKYETRAAGEDQHAPYPLNFVGQMPMLEDHDLTMSAVPKHDRQSSRGAVPEDSSVEGYEAPSVDGQSDSGAELAAITSDVHSLDQDEDSRVANVVFDEMSREMSEEAAQMVKHDHGDKTAAQISAEDRLARDGSRKVHSQSRRGAKSTSAVIGSPTMAETDKMVKQSKMSKKKKGAAAAAAPEREEAVTPVLKVKKAEASKVSAPKLKLKDDAGAAAPKKAAKAPKAGSFAAGKLAKGKVTEEQAEMLRKAQGGLFKKGKGTSDNKKKRW